MEQMTVVMQGRAGTGVTFMETEETGNAYARFRMAVPRARRTPGGGWEQLEPHWYTVKAWGELARNVWASIHKGEPLIVTGQPRAMGWIDNEGEARAEIAIHAVAVGHDLAKGFSSFGKRVADRQIPDRDTGEIAAGTERAAVSRTADQDDTDSLTPLLNGSAGEEASAGLGWPVEESQVDVGESCDEQDLDETLS